MARPIQAASASRSPIASRHAGWQFALPALASGMAGLILAWHYPLMAWAASALFITASVVFGLYPATWLVALPALLPIIGLAPWTGWITFEEFDLLVLAVAAGGYARLALQAPRRMPAASALRSHARGANGLVWLMAMLFAASLLSAMLRGFADAGGFSFGWYQGYREPMNSLRLAKSFFAALLLFPLWNAAQRQSSQPACDKLTLGLTLSVLTVSLAALWERLAFTGLVNFSSDYRTTALFWEMQVGGAAFDGFLALTVPFALRELLTAGSRKRWLGAACIALLAGYACLTTFSRAVYLAVPLGVAVMYGAHSAQFARLHPDRWRGQLRGAWFCVALATAFAVAAAWMFPTSGYRGMLALLGGMLVLLPTVTALRGSTRADWLAGLCLGIVFSIVAAACSWLLPKGPYAVYAVSVAFTLAWLMVQRWPPSRAGSRYATAMLLAGFIWVLSGIGLIAAQWGGEAALWRALPVIALLFATAALAHRTKGGAWPSGLRWQGTAVAAMALAGSVVAAFGGGAYMTDRFSTTGGDLDGRLQHWQHGVAMLKTPQDLLLGKGLGRFFDNYSLDAPKDKRPGDYRLHDEGGNTYLTLVAGTHPMGWGELLRVSQRVQPPVGPAFVRFDVRTAQPLTLHFDVCMKHLLYASGCLIKELKVAPLPGVWQTVQTELAGNQLSRGEWYAPKLAAFSVAAENSDRRTEIDNLVLAGADGRNLLANGDFSDGMARWFFTSDRNHLPWHIKNVALHLLIEQGVIGLVLWCALLLGALWRVTFGHARAHHLAPGIAGGLAAFAAVGAFDSLLDVPRVAFLFYFLTLLALTLKSPNGVPNSVFAGSGRDRRDGRDGGRSPGSSSLAWLFAAALSFAALPRPAEAATEGSAVAAASQVIEVGPHRAVKTIAEASRLAKDGAMVLVDAGTYARDTASWSQSHLTLRAVGGRARLVADGAAAERKGIWVMSGMHMSVEGFDFEGAAVPDRNGAGIRLERGSLRVLDCSFTHNEMGILTNNDQATTLEVVNSEFAHNQRPGGHNHNLYAGTIQRLTVTGSYFHHGHSGHLLKSRAAFNHITYNRLTDEADGHASYELEFPNGGVAWVIGNIIQQGPQTENPHLISFGAEGYRWPANELYLAHNTLIDDRAEPGVFLRVRPGATPVRIVDNLLVGSALWDLPSGAQMRNNVSVKSDALDRSVAGGFRIENQATGWHQGPDVGSAHGESLIPLREYRHPRHTAALDGPLIQVGAMQTTKGR